MDNMDWAQRGEQVFIGTYSRFPVMMERGEGCRLWDAEGREYLDFLGGIAVCALGHCHPRINQAICEQACKLVHVSNLFHMQPQIELAELLTRNTFADKIFLANSGAEANEAALKLARLHGGAGRYELISLSGSFHGRTMNTLAATGQPKFHEGFEPLPQGYVHAAFGDLESVEQLINEKTCGILCEPLQGEGGVRPLDPGYLKKLRALCDKHGLLLIFDEIQTGMGRTGTLFAYQQAGVVPDIMTSAKALGNGLPIGAMLTTDEIARSFGVGSHGSTFGGNPVAASAAVAVLKEMLKEGFFEEVQRKSAYFIEKLDALAAQFPAFATGVRGKGLLLGLVLTEKGCEQGSAIVQKMFERGVLINFAGNQVLRFMPPLIIANEDIDRAVAALSDVLGDLAG